MSGALSAERRGWSTGRRSPRSHAASIGRRAALFRRSHLTAPSSPPALVADIGDALGVPAGRGRRQRDTTTPDAASMLASSCGSRAPAIRRSQGCRTCARGALQDRAGRGDGRRGRAAAPRCGAAGGLRLAALPMDGGLRSSATRECGSAAAGAGRKPRTAPRPGVKAVTRRRSCEHAAVPPPLRSIHSNPVQVLYRGAADLQQLLRGWSGCDHRRAGWQGRT